MGVIEAILTGIQIERLQKPLIFFFMLIGLLFFTLVGVAVVAISVMEFFEGKELLASLGGILFSTVFFGLSAVCGYMIKRCVQ